MTPEEMNLALEALPFLVAGLVALFTLASLMHLTSDDDDDGEAE